MRLHLPTPMSQPKGQPEPCDLSTAIGAAARLPTADATLAGIADPRAWFEESFAIAKQSVYTSAIGDGHGPFSLDDAYKAQALDDARVRAALAGARLANMLNAALR